MPKLKIIIQKCVHINFNNKQNIFSGLKNYAWGSSDNCYNKYNYYHFFGTQKVISYIYIYIYISHIFTQTQQSAFLRLKECFHPYSECLCSVSFGQRGERV